MNKSVTMIIADRNPHVREFLKREMMAEGYQIRLIKSGQELIDSIHNSDSLPDLVILDPDFPDINDLPLVCQIRHLAPKLPVIVHTLQTEMIQQLNSTPSIVLVEKKGSSVDHLKQAVKSIMHME